MKRTRCILSLLILSLAAMGCRRPPANQAEGISPERASETLKTSEVAVFERVYQDRLLRGFYPGNQQWRWTGRQFAVSLDVPPPLDAATVLEMDFAVPSELIAPAHRVTLTMSVNGQKVGTEIFTDQGRHTKAWRVPPAALKKTPAVIEGELDKSGTAEGHEVGLIVVGVSLKHPDTTALDHDTATELARQGYTQLLKRRQLDVPEAQQAEMMKLFHKIPIWSKMWFHNVPIGKNPLDLWMMQQIMYETQPEYVIETGTYMGGSALYWAHTLNGLGLEKSRVFTMDVSDYTATAVKHPLWNKYVTFIQGSSTDPAIVARIAERVKGHKTLVTLDSDHSQQHVLNELHAYAPLVSRGSYLVVEDTHMDGVPTSPSTGPGPMAAVLEFLKTGGSRNFEQDFSREAFIMTFNPGGWLRRK